jgi:hypothetical protein
MPSKEIVLNVMNADPNESFKCNSIISYPIQSFAHDNSLILVCAQYGYPKGSPNTNS